MSAIFDNANSITLGHKLSLIQTNSHSGKRSAQRRGPYLYKFDVEVNDMATSDIGYTDITSELRSINYGVSTLITTITPTHTSSRGSWLGTVIVNGASQSGNSIKMDGFLVSTPNVIRDGDYIQFSGDSKVYQAIGDYDSDSSGNAVASGSTTQGVTLNTPLVRSPSDNSVITDGSSVQFKLALVSYEDATISPRNGVDNVASWSGFSFEEVI